MFTAKTVVRTSRVLSRSFSASSASRSKVAVLGAAGGIGQPLSLLLKAAPNISKLALYDIVNTPGVAADISHVSTKSEVKGYTGDAELADALKGADVVVIPAGVPRKPGMTRDDLFNTNASIVHTLAKSCAKNCPNAKILVISNPVNSTVPIIAETLKREGNVYDPRKVFGVTTLDVVRARTFIGQLKGQDPNSIDVTVVGGHSGITILPLLSRVKGVSFTQEEVEQLTHRIQFGGDEVVKAKAGAGSATLSMAYAGALFTQDILRAAAGENVTACTFVQQQDGSPHTQFFSTPVTLDKEGVKEIHADLGELSAYEQQVYDDMQAELKKNIEKGVAFVESQY
mmetsp:Transcript_8016/g.13855  ORF Transcript_8016/g.13855 Transcript_8016/m.13855 type:complete len:342 (-) Transcript_8016:37-1062(-)